MRKEGGTGWGRGAALGHDGLKGELAGGGRVDLGNAVDEAEEELVKMAVDQQRVVLGHGGLEAQPHGAHRLVCQGQQRAQPQQARVG